ncbi:MAG: TonB-dependent receptor [Bacteroidota bacterium]|nr:TonB-dependent receptor [Bacteroidota bacterium]
MKKITQILILIFIGLITKSQDVSGTVTSNNKNISFANIVIKGTKIGSTSDENGLFKLKNVPLGNQTLLVSKVGMKEKEIILEVKKGENILDVELSIFNQNLDQVVISGTRTVKKILDSPIIVDIINSQKLENLQACYLAEGLNFQSGLRIETDCQTCNYTQLRINGLDGGYSQILINGRSIFSPLAGLYGLEQIPSNMIERIEIVKGGGSSLYGSSAIAGTVNIITKNPSKNSYQFGYNISAINIESNDMNFQANSSVVSENMNSGITFFINQRTRTTYDHNSDNFSEIPYLQNKTFGINLFYKISELQQIKIHTGNIYEYRYGGEMIDQPPHLNMQSEERIQNILFGDINYQIDFNKNSNFISYLAIQQTKREHYTGIRPEIGSLNDLIFLSNPPYGKSNNSTMQSGIQLNHEMDYIFGSNMISTGFEYMMDDIFDEIKSYNYLIQQKVNNLGAYIQSDWTLHKNFNFLSGIRIDKNSLINSIIISPRSSLLYKLNNNFQLRTTYSKGFRAPQAFDTDLHIAFSGGGISTIQLANNLKEEKSNSLSSSLNFNKSTKENYFGFTIESFYNRLQNVFYLDPIGLDESGEIYVKRNGDGATVKGLNVELRTNLNNKIQFESGLTYQRSEFDDAISYSVNLEPKKEFLRTPKMYGYATFDYYLNEKINLMTNFIHTGRMNLVHLAGSPNQTEDEYVTSEMFNVLGIKITYIKKIKKLDSKLELSIGVKNLTNDYQNNFDSTKNRDSNFIYGPSYPRQIYFGLNMKSL